MTNAIYVMQQKLEVISSENPFETIYEQARAFMADRGIHYYDDFRETAGAPLKFVGINDPEGRAKNNKSEWLYVSFLDECPGIRITFGSHRLPDLGSITKTFKINDEKYSGLTEKELAHFEVQKKINQEHARERERREKEEADKQADYALEKYSNASTINPPADAITYLSKKGLIPSDLIRWEKATYYTENAEPVIEWIALCALENFQGKTRALQELYPRKRKFHDGTERNKNFIGKTSRCFFRLGSLEDGRKIYLCEGIATAISIFLATNQTCLAVLSCGGYEKIVEEIRKRFPKSEIVICSDNDSHKENNPGLQMAKAVAVKYKCRLASPEFPENYRLNAEGEPNKDFDDMRQMQAMGKEEVKRQIEIATIPKEKAKVTQAKESDIIDQDDDSEEAGDTLKARVTARRKAIAGTPHVEIVKTIHKQYPTLKDRSEDIASKALSWAEEQKTGCKVNVGGIPKTITNMKILDTQFAQLEASGQPCVIIHRSDAQPISSKDFNQRLSGSVVVSGVDDKGQIKYVDASKYWTGNTNKYIYKNIVFTNKPVGNDTYNLFTGFGIKPINKGKCDKILIHIKDVICAGDEVNNTAFIKLLAWQLQNIGKPSRIITALKSKAQQVGKGCLLADIMAVIYGNSGFLTSDLGQIITRFNDTLRGKAFLFLDEALFAGDRKSADAIKSLATTTRMGVESKGIPTVQFPIAVNLFLTTNHDDAAHVEESDARYWILEVRSHRAKDVKYFDELYAEIENGGREAFMYHLLNLNVKDFVPSRDVPIDNTFKDAMIRNSINPYDARKWLEASCRAEMIIGLRPIDEKSPFPWEPWEQGVEYANGLFFAAYDEWQKTVKSPVGAKPTPGNKIGELLTKAGLTQRNDRGRKRRLPDPIECLKIVAEMIDKVGK